MYDYQARYYDPLLGRFVSADSIVPNPIDSQDWNRYTYVRNSPVRYTDPSGHCLVPPVTFGCIALIVVAGGLALAGYVYVQNPEPINEIIESFPLPGPKPAEKPEGISLDDHQDPAIEGDIPLQSGDATALPFPLSTPEGLTEESPLESGPDIPPYMLSDATTGGPYRGGPYGRLNAKSRVIERHHLLPQAVSPLSEYSGPSIQMDYRDHRNLLSTGSRTEAKAHRQRLAELVAQGRHMDAVQLEIDAIRSQYGDKYDDAIEEALRHFPDEWK